MMHYLDEGSGTPLLLLHGFPLSSEMYRDQIEGLRSNFRIIAPDFPGFGKTPPANQPLSMDFLASCALVLLDHLKIDRIALGGVSMGGYVAMAVLRQDAGRVSGLALLNTQATPDDEAQKARRIETARAIRQEGTSYLFKTLVPKFLAPTASPSLHKRVDAMVQSATVEGAAEASLGMGLRPDSRDMLARFSGPAKVLTGEKDELIPIAKSKQMQEVLSGAELITIQGAGHLANMESPDQVNVALKDLLKTLS